MIVKRRKLKDQSVYFKVPQSVQDCHRVHKIVLKICDEYLNILKGMYSTRFNVSPTDSDTSVQDDPVPRGPMTPLIVSQILRLPPRLSV